MTLFFFFLLFSSPSSFVFSATPIHGCSFNPPCRISISKSSKVFFLSFNSTPTSFVSWTRCAQHRRNHRGSNPSPSPSFFPPPFSPFLKFPPPPAFEGERRDRDLLFPFFPLPPSPTLSGHEAEGSSRALLALRPPPPFLSSPPHTRYAARETDASGKGFFPPFFFFLLLLMVFGRGGLRVSFKFLFFLLSCNCLLIRRGRKN